MLLSQTLGAEGGFQHPSSDFSRQRSIPDVFNDFCVPLLQRLYSYRTHTLPLWYLSAKFSFLLRLGYRRDDLSMQLYCFIQHPPIKLENIRSP